MNKIIDKFALVPLVQPFFLFVSYIFPVLAFCEVKTVIKEFKFTKLRPPKVFSNPSDLDKKRFYPLVNYHQ